MSERRVFSVDCACVGSCTILRVEKWDDEPEFYAELYVVPTDWDWRSRLRHAWNALTGRYANSPSPVLMEPEARRLGEWLLEHLGDA